MSLDVETHAHHHAHKTGHSWVDMTVAFSALFVSVVSLGVAILHGRTMESMAEANAKLVSANSWPYLSYGAGTVTVNGGLTVNMHVANTGVGPAKIESAELVWKGVAYRSDSDFLKACCNVDLPLEKFDNATIVANQVLRAGDHIDFFILDQSASPQAFEALKKAVLSPDLKLIVCYCSIFDECWKDDLTKLSLTPPQVKSCQLPKVPFDQDLLGKKT